jgi:biopolymer transport protein ExbD
MKLKQHIHLLRGPMDLTPMMDVVLLLLIFFMLSSSFILQPGIRVDLPRSTWGKGATADQLVISVMLEPERVDAATGFVAKRQPYIFFNDQIMTFDNLQTAVAQVARKRPNQSLVLKADQATSMGLLVDIMNMAMKNGLSVVIATQRADGFNQ